MNKEQIEKRAREIVHDNDDILSDETWLIEEIAAFGQEMLQLGRKQMNDEEPETGICPKCRKPKEYDCASIPVCKCGSENK